ncbi:MAG: class I SAM-dependent methyltransferase [Acidimicrobiales bacterium]
MTYTRRACPTCDGYLAEQIHRLRLKTPDGHPLEDGYDVVACLSCGTGFADVEIAQDYYDLYYANQAKYASEAATGTQTISAAEPAWKAERLKEAASLIASMLVDKDSRILDIGCANGTLLGALQEVGFLDVRGIDPSPGSAAMAKSHYGVQVDVGTFSDLPSDLGIYDCVCVTGVLEHVFDIKAAMRTLVELLRPGGIIYLDVPDASRYLQPYISPFEDFSTEHVNHFSLSTLKTLGNRFGLATLHFDQFITELVLGVPCAAIRLVWQQRSPHHHSSGVIRDEELVASLYDFTSRSQAEFVEIEQQLEARLIDQDEFAIWGIGEYTFKLLASDPLVRRKAVALVDGNSARWGMSVGGVRVKSPDSLLTLSASVPLIIGSRLSEQPIRLAIAKLRLENQVLST